MHIFYVLCITCKTLLLDFISYESGLKIGKRQKSREKENFLYKYFNLIGQGQLLDIFLFFVYSIFSLEFFSWTHMKWNPSYISRFNYNVIQWYCWFNVSLWTSVYFIHLQQHLQNCWKYITFVRFQKQVTIEVFLAGNILKFHFNNPH